jgi:hypothetical protein
MPLSCFDSIAPGKMVQVSARSQVNVGLSADSLLIAGSQKWRIHEFRTAPRIGGTVVPGDHLTHGDRTMLPCIAVAEGVHLEVEYCGDAVQGAAIKLWARAVSSKHGEHVVLALPDRAHDLYVTDLTLRVANPEHWMVSDVCVGDDTLFVDAGQVPGEIFADRPGRTRIRLGRLRAQEALVVRAYYVGPLPEACFAYEVTGAEVPVGEIGGDVAFLPLTSDVPIKPGPIRTVVQVTTRAGVPQGYAFVPEEVVLRDPSHWIVGSVRVGNVMQFVCVGAVPGAVFSHGPLWFDPVRSRMDFVLQMTSAGSATGGGSLACGCVGRVVRA